MLLMLLFAGGCPSGLQPEAICLSPVQGATYAGGPSDRLLVQLGIHWAASEVVTDVMHVTYPNT